MKTVVLAWKYSKLNLMLVQNDFCLILSFLTFVPLMICVSRYLFILFPKYLWGMLGNLPYVQKNFPFEPFEVPAITCAKEVDFIAVLHVSST